MRRFFAKLGYSILAIFGLLMLVGMLADTAYSNAGVLVFLIGSPAAIFLIFGKGREKGVTSEGDNQELPITAHTVEAVTTTAGSTISASPNKSYKLPSRSIAKVEFLSSEETTDIYGYSIRGLLWVGPLTKRSAEYEPAVIDRKRSIAKTELAEPLGYWSNYSNLDPEQRNRYLRWLAGDRAEIEDLGYLFLYFYGFERYVLRGVKCEPQSLKEKNLSDIVKEVDRLRKQFSNKSFQNYSDQLLDVIYVLHWPERIDERKSAFPGGSAIAAHYVIAKLANESPDEVLDPDWALHWLLGFGSVSRTKMIREQYPVLRMLFKASYLKITDGGMKVPKCRTKLKINLTPASHGLEEFSPIDTPDDWCDPTGLKRPMTKLLEVNDEVMPALRALGRAIAKKEISGILAAWPESVPLESVPKLKQISERLDAALGASPTMEASSLAKMVSATVGDKLTLTQIKNLAKALRSLQYTLVPHPEVTPSVVKGNETVLCYKGECPKELSPEGIRIALTCQLGALLASSDGNIHHAEEALLRRMIKSHSNPVERKYLDCYLTWRLGHPPSTAGVKKQVNQLDGAQKHEIARLLVDLALADQELAASEIKQLEKLFKQLGLDQGLVTELLHKASSSDATFPMETNSDKKAGTSVALDKAALDHHTQSTKDIQSVLGQIFSESDEEEVAPDTKQSQSATASDSWHEGRLDQAHDSLASWMFTKDEWTLEAVTKRCTDLGLFVDGALDTINEASFEALGDSLIEVGDPIEVYRDVLPE